MRHQVVMPAMQSTLSQLNDMLSAEVGKLAVQFGDKLKGTASASKHEQELRDAERATAKKAALAAQHNRAESTTKGGDADKY